MKNKKTRTKPRVTKPAAKPKANVKSKARTKPLPPLALKVACPSCGARAGDPCILLTHPGLTRKRAKAAFAPNASVLATPSPAARTRMAAESALQAKPIANSAARRAEAEPEGYNEPRRAGHHHILIHVDGEGRVVSARNAWRQGRKDQH